MNKVFKFSKCPQLLNNCRMQAQSSKASQEVWDWSKNSIILIYQFSVLILNKLLHISYLYLKHKEIVNNLRQNKSRKETSEFFNFLK